MQLWNVEERGQKLYQRQTSNQTLRWYSGKTQPPSLTIIWVRESSTASHPKSRTEGHSYPSFSIHYHNNFLFCQIQQVFILYLSNCIIQDVNKSVVMYQDLLQSNFWNHRCFCSNTYCYISNLFQPSVFLFWKIPINIILTSLFEIYIHLSSFFIMIILYPFF